MMESSEEGTSPTSEFDGEFAELEDILLADALDKVETHSPSQTRSPSAQPPAPPSTPADKGKLILLDQPTSGLTISIRRPTTKGTNSIIHFTKTTDISSKSRAQSVPIFDDNVPLRLPNIWSPSKLDEQPSPEADNESEQKTKVKASMSSRSKNANLSVHSNARRNANIEKSYAESESET
jgi:hypothetical protein